MKDTPVALGMHPNTELNYRQNQCNMMCDFLLDIVPKEEVGGDDEGDEKEGGGSDMQKAEEKMALIMDKVGADEVEKVAGRKFELRTIKEAIGKDKKPFQNSFIQELECMNLLCEKIIKSLVELKMGLEGAMSISEDMEVLIKCLVLEKVPPQWAKFA